MLAAVFLWIIGQSVLELVVEKLGRKPTIDTASDILEAIKSKHLPWEYLYLLNNLLIQWAQKLGNRDCSYVWGWRS